MSKYKEKAPEPAKVPGAYGEQLVILTPPLFCPSWPTRGTLADLALSRFLAGEALNHPDFQTQAQCWRLAAVVYELRKLGWPIETVDIQSPTIDNPNRVIARYHLPGKYVALAMEMKGAA